MARVARARAAVLRELAACAAAYRLIHNLCVSVRIYIYVHAYTYICTCRPTFTCIVLYINT